MKKILFLAVLATVISTASVSAQNVRAMVQRSNANQDYTAVYEWDGWDSAGAFPHETTFSDRLKRGTGVVFKNLVLQKTDGSYEISPEFSVWILEDIPGTDEAYPQRKPARLAGYPKNLRDYINLQVPMEVTIKMERLTSGIVYWVYLQ